MEKLVIRNEELGISNVPSVQNNSSLLTPNSSFKKGFTLAEVLITLGVIGIVAALTMPALIANYQKKVLETRIKKFYSVMQQAVNIKTADEGMLDLSMITSVNDLDEVEEFVNINYGASLKIINKQRRTSGVVYAFPDGSGMYVYTRINPAGAVVPGINWCVNHKHCLEFTERTGTGNQQPDNRNAFYFNFDGKTELATNPTRAIAFSRCTGGNPGYASTCSALLQYDNWEIKDDYPWF